MTRNIDKIKGLTNQNEELKRQNEILKAKIAQYAAGLKEIQIANDAAMITVILAYGEEKLGGIYEVEIPKIDISCVDKYELRAGQNKEGDMRWISVTKREEEKVLN